MNITLTFDNPHSAAQYIVDHCTESSVFCFEGDLGAGKTTTIQEMCRILGFLGEVSSPTYALINEYPVKKGIIYHMDLYRLKDINEALDIGIEDYLFDSKGTCFIEWPSLIQDNIDLDRYDIAIKKVIDSDNSRQVSIKYIKY